VSVDKHDVTFRQRLTADDIHRFTTEELMPDLQFNTHLGQGATTTLHAASIDSLQSSLDGRLLTYGSPEYDEARTIWNAMIDRRPALIVRCLSTSDVVNAVNFARENNIVMSVRGGGHNIAGNAVCEGGLMIDLSQMRSVSVDSVARTARVGGGATLADVDRATQEFGLATPFGINSTTGVAGLTLGGGFGWLSRRFGLSCDNLIGAEIVLANGSMLHVSETENADLLWGLRGGGGNFGVVTNFEFRLHPIGREVLAGLVIHPLDEAKGLLQSYREIHKTLPDTLSCWFILRQAPPMPFVPEEWHGKEILAFAIFGSGPIEDAEQAIAPIRALGTPIVDVVGPMQYTVWQSMFDAAGGPGARNYWKTNTFDELSDGFIDVLIDHAWNLPDPQTDIAVAALGGAVNRLPASATAYPHRSTIFVPSIHGRWTDPAKDDACIAWARSLTEKSAPFSTGGAYVNFLTQEETDRVRAAYGPNYDRLVELKNKYDPTNLFRLNQNIKPSGEVEGIG
jgi:FAD/FMN-containing dehydrogenase